MAGIIVPQLADAIGARQVRRYALTGERFDAHEARRIGLVHEVVRADELQSAGEACVARLLQNAPDANAQTKAAALEFAWGGASVPIRAYPSESKSGLKATSQRWPSGSWKQAA